MRNSVAGKKKLSRVGKAEIKIMAVFIYYILIGAMGLITSTYGGFSNVGESLEALIICESTGNQECDVNLDTYRRLTVMGILNIATFFFSPVMAFLFSFNPMAWKRAIQ